MGFLDEARAAERRGGRACPVERIKESLPPEDRAEYQAAVDDRSLTAASISRALVAWDAGRLPPAAITRHRRGECRCSR